MREALTFDDVALVPSYNNIPSRLEPDLSTWLARDRRMGIPIIAANMDTVIGEELADVLIKYGSVPIFHRFTDFEKQLDWVEKYKDKSFISTGANPEDVDLAMELLKRGAGGVCIDIAHGHANKMSYILKHLRNYIDNNLSHNPKIIAGNVCTRRGYIDLVSWGADAVKCGVGPGAACTTRVVTGFGVPQFTAIQDCATEAKAYGVPIIADGGIRGSADIMKALAAGACSVMIGKMFALTEESAAEKKGGDFITNTTFDKDGIPITSHDVTIRLAKFRGQASEDFQKDFKGGLKEGTVAEGTDFWAPITGTASELLDNLLGGLRSGFTYGGARHMDELQRKAEFVKVNSGSYSKESNPRKN